MRKEVGIVHYNTPELTIATIKSVKKHTIGCHFTIFDNSDKRPFICDEEDVTVIDNTKGQIIDFQKVIDEHPFRYKLSKSKHGSEKHMLSVQKLFDIIGGSFLLLDSDVLIKKDISMFFDNNYSFIGSKKLGYVGRDKIIHKERLFPFILWINVEMCNKHGVKFAREGKLWFLNFKGKEHPCYDTGASFLEECVEKKLPHKYVNIGEYMIHFGAGSYGKDKNESLKWLEQNNKYFNN